MGDLLNIFPEMRTDMLARPIRTREPVNR